MWIEETEEGGNGQRTGVERFSNRVYYRGAGHKQSEIKYLGHDFFQLRKQLNIVEFHRDTSG